MNKFLSIFKDYPDDFIFNDYEWEYKELIGQGAFGKIFKVRNKKNNKFDAIKQLDMKNFDEQFKIQALKSEIEIMDKIKSQNIVELKDFFMGKKFTYIVLQLCDSDLRKILVSNQGKLPQKLCCEIFNQLAKGFYQINKNQYIHRDIKPQNILVKENVFKVADFGFTKKVKKNQLVEQSCGTPLYMAPQLIFNQKYTAKCDIWSLGLMLYEMVFGYNPWPTKHPEVYKNSIKTKPICFPYDAKIGKNTFNFLKRCLKVQQKERFTWQQFFNHPFIKQKNLGQPIQLPKIQQRSQRVIRSVQQSVLRKNIDFLGAFQNYSKKILTKVMRKYDIYAFLQQIDPTITTYEADLLFLLTDNDKNGQITLDEFKDIFCSIDFRSADDVVSRRIQQIIVIAQTRNISMQSLFDLFDKDQSKTIQKQQFENLIKKIVPKINSFQIQQIWNRFDSNNSGKIQKNEFFSEMTRNCNHEIALQIERARRNILCLAQYLESRKSSLKQFFRSTDTNNDNQLTLDEFGTMINKINYEISKDEIIQMFKLFDENQNEFLNLREMQKTIIQSKII